MNHSVTPLMGRTSVAAALMMAFGSAFAQQSALTPDEMRRELYTPQSRITIGVGSMADNNRGFGQYRGLTEAGTYGLVDVDVRQRDDSAGTWMKLRGRSLGLSGREVRFDHERQGDWSYFIEAGQASREEPLQVNTGLQGIGTAVQTVSAAAAKRDVDLGVDRTSYALGMRKFFSGGFDVRVSARQEDKQGERMLGIFSNTFVLDYLTEPIDQVTRQWEVVAGYTDRKLQLSAGYSGSTFDNGIPVLSDKFGATSTALAMTPSNHAHKLHVSGGYSWSDTTRNTFKLSRSVAYQNDPFVAVFPRLAGTPDSLNAQVITTLAFVDWTMRPMERLNLGATLRLEDRDDQTPQVQFIKLADSAMIPSTTGAFSSPGLSGFNKPRKLKQTKASLDAAYQLDSDYRLLGSLEYEDSSRNRVTGALSGLTGANAVYNGLIPLRVAYRENTHELTGRVEIKRALSETFNGSVALLRSVRGGSDYVADTFVAAANTNQVNSLMWSDRSRDKLRLSADWTPADQWTVQVMADLSEDRYSGRHLGPRTGSARFLSGDANYRINDKWSLISWVSKEVTQSRQSTRTDPAAADAKLKNILWDADLGNSTMAWGIGLKGQPRANLVLGADLSAALDVTETGMVKVGGTGTAAVNSLPDYYYRQLTLKLFADYALDRQSGVRVDLALDRRHNNDWSWTGFTYADGTTVLNVPSENSGFVGISYHIRWR